MNEKRKEAKTHLNVYHSLPSPVSLLSLLARRDATGGGFGGGYEYLDFGCEAEDEDEDADLLCDFAPGALQADGSMGLMDSDGTHVLIPPTPPDGAYAPHPRFKTSYIMSHGSTEQQRRAMMLGHGSRHYANGGETVMMTPPMMMTTPEEPCLSDSWHAAAARSDSSDSSITALRHQYHRVFGKETSSNNRQWLLRRLAKIDSAYGDEEDHELDHDHDHDGAMLTARSGAGYHSGDHSGNGSASDLEEATPLYSSLGRHNGIVGGNFFGVADSDHHPPAVGLKGRRGSGSIQGGAAAAVGRGSGKRQVKPSRQFNDGNGRAPGRHSAKTQQHQLDQRQGRKGSGHHSKRSRDSDSHGSEGGSKSAKTDASAASPGKKYYKKGHHSDSDDHSAGEPPVKSRNNSHHAQHQQQQHNRKSAAGRKGSAEGGANGTAPGTNSAGANGRRSKHHNPWALEEAEALVEGVARCGGGKWADIKKLGFAAIEHRTAVDLKDKWRNLLRIAMLPHQPVKSAGDKKREIPPALLARVRELAAKQAKKAAQDGRSRGSGRT